MDIEEAFRQVGEYGSLQKRVFWSMAIPQVFVAWHHLHNVFVSAEPQFRCVRAAIPTDGCPKVGETPCDRYDFSGGEFTSVVSEWNLVCSESYKADLIQSVYMAGLLFGNLAGGYIADQYGRRHLSYIGALLMTFFSLIAMDASSYNSYLCWRFLAGVCTGAWGLVSFTLPTELVGPKQRGFVNVVMTVNFALGVGSLSLLAFFIRDWKQLSLVTALPGLIGIYYYKVVPESPRWLLTQGRIEEAEHVLTSIALFNNNHPPSSPIHLRPLSIHPVKAKQAGVLDILRNATLRNITANNLYTWFVNSMVYYGLTMRAGNLNGDRYVNVALAGLIEIPADIVTLYLMDVYGRRSTYSWSMLFGGIFCVGIIITPGESSIFKTVLALLGKMGISMSFCVAWMHAAEMYPTCIRNKALSICNTSSRLGGVFSPMVLTLGRIYPNMDFAVFGLMAFFGGVASRRLPETLNCPMPETVEDIDSWMSLPLKTRIIDLSQPKIMERSIKKLEGDFEELQRLRDSEEAESW